MPRPLLYKLYETGDIIRKATWHDLQPEGRLRPGETTGQELKRGTKETFQRWPRAPGKGPGS